MIETLPPLLRWDDGIPVSLTHDDVYYSREDGLAEARHVFLQGNALAERLAALPDHAGEVFCVGETGFGTGLNMLAVWELWQTLGKRHARLDLISVERHPWRPADLTMAHARWPGLSPLAARLRERLPPPLPGIHRVELAPRVSLTLIHGEAVSGLASVDAQVDAWCLDGFSPARNPDLWSPDVFAQLARLSRPGTTLATFTAAGAVRRALSDAGFALEKRPGFGRKRHMTAGRYERSHAGPSVCRPEPPRDAIVIGGGLAGCAAARALAERGMTVTLLEAGPALASGTSGNPVGMTFLRLTPHASAQNRFYQAAWLFALQRLRDVFTEAGMPEGTDWQLDGVFQLLDDPRTASALQAFRDRHPDIDWLGGDREMAVPGLPLVATVPGLTLSRGGWLHPPALCRALASHPGISVLTGFQCDDVVPTSGDWTVISGDQRLSSACVILATGHRLDQWPVCEAMPITRIRGQITQVPATDTTATLARVVNFDGYVTPPWRGFHCVGATFQPGRQDTDVYAEDHVENLQRLQAVIPAWPMPPEVTGRAGVRASTRDYLPLIGPVPRPDDPARAWPGLWVSAAHGSRGITSSLLAGEMLAHGILGAPAPVERDVVDAVHPGRFAARAARRR